MSDEKKLDDLFNGFSKLNYDQRLSRLQQSGLIDSDELNFLAAGGIKDIILGENFIENSIGYFQIPLGVATHFRIDGSDHFIPMAVEETSIIAAASKTAKWIKENGEIKTHVVGTDIIGQIQLAKVTDFNKFEAVLIKNKERL